MRCTTAVLQKLRTKPYVALAPVVYCVTVQNWRMANTIERRSDWGGRGGWVSEEEKYKKPQAASQLWRRPDWPMCLIVAPIFMSQTQKSPFLQNTASEYSSPLICFYFCRTLPLEYKAGTIFWWHIYIYCISVNIWMCSLGQEISHKNISSVFLRNHHFLAVFDRLFSLLNCIFYKQKLLNLDFLSEKPHQLIYIVAVVTGTIPPLCVRTTKKIFLLKQEYSNNIM